MKKTILDSGYKNTILTNTISKEDTNTHKDIINLSCLNYDYPEFYYKYKIEGMTYNYDINNPQAKNETIESIYNLLKTYTLNDNLTEEEFKNYLNSYFIYKKYYTFTNLSMILEYSPSNEDLYYKPFVNITADTNYSFNYYEDDINTRQKNVMYFNLPLTVKIIAEGKTKI